MPNRDEIVERAMGLSSEDRAFVADALERSLDNQGFASQEVATAWAAEIERRIEAYDRGEVHADDVGPVIERLRQYLRKVRAGKVSP